MTHPEHPIVEFLWPLGPDGDPTARIEATYRAFTKSTGESLGPTPSDDERHRVADWLMAQEDSMPVIDDQGHSLSLLHVKVPRMKPLIHPVLASKVSWLQQAPCLTCVRDEQSPSLGVSFGVRVRPFSAQSMESADLKLIKQRISESMEGRLGPAKDWSASQVCVTVVAVVNAKARQKDVDNMAKGLLDSLQGHLYLNDSQIAHLSISRVRHRGDDAFYLLSARPVLDPLEDVIDPELRISWAGRPEITLDS